MTDLLSSDFAVFFFSTALTLLIPLLAEPKSVYNTRACLDKNQISVVRLLHAERAGGLSQECLQPSALKALGSLIYSHLRSETMY